MLNILWRNMKWRFQNPLSIAVTILQPLLWLILYSSVAGQTMQNMGIGNYTAFILPGIIVLVTFSACSSGGIINFIMKSSGSFYRVLISPNKPEFYSAGANAGGNSSFFYRSDNFMRHSSFFLSKGGIRT